MYAIGQVIFGWDLTAGFEDKDWEWGIENASGDADPLKPRLRAWYSGSGSKPLAFGVELDEIIETQEVDLDALMETVHETLTPELREAVVDARDELYGTFSEETLSEMPAWIAERLIQPPKTRIVWSTS